MQKLLKYFQNTYFLLMLGVAVSITACKKDDGDTPPVPQVIDGPSITITEDATAYKAGGTVKIKMNVKAPGKLKEVKVGTQSITSFNDETNATIEVDYVIPAATAAGNHEVLVTAVDKQTPEKKAEKKAIIKVESAGGGGGTEECTADAAESISGSAGINFTGQTTAFDAFGNIEGGIVDNPFVGGINTSCKVFRFFRKGGCTDWAGQGKEITDAIDFASTTKKIIKLKVYAVDKVAPITIRLEKLPYLESDPDRVNPVAEVIVTPTKIGEWEELTFDFSGFSETTHKSVILYIDRGKDCDESTYYYDDMVQVEK